MEKGQKMSEEQKRKIGIANKGRIMGEEFRHKNSISHLGIKYPNRKSPPPRTKEHTEHFIESFKKVIRTPEWKRHISESHLGNKNPMFGKKQSAETIAKRMKGIVGRKCTETTREKLRAYRISHPNTIRKDTLIEIKIEDELKKRGIYYQKQVPLCKVAVVDFYLPEYRIVIQADGCYWHGCPERFPNPTEKQIFTKKRDNNQDSILTFNGFNVYRFWEHEIKKDVGGCIDRLTL